MLRLGVVSGRGWEDGMHVCGSFLRISHPARMTCACVLDRGAGEARQDHIISVCTAGELWRVPMQGGKNTVLPSHYTLTLTTKGRPEVWQAHTCARCCRSRVKLLKQARQGLSWASARGADADMGSWKTEGNRRSRPMSRTALAGSCPEGPSTASRGCLQEGIQQGQHATPLSLCCCDCLVELRAATQVHGMHSSVSSLAAQAGVEWRE